MRQLRVVISGGAGFIGSHFARKLVREGHKVTIVDRADWSSSCLHQLGLLAHPSVTCVTGSVTDQSMWDELPDDFDYVVHAAAILGIDRVPAEQLNTLDTTILGTRRALEFACRQADLKRFLYLSTSEVYGPSAAASDEEVPAHIMTDDGRWCYATAKLAGEFYLKAFAQSENLEFTIVRPFNVYGPFRTGPNAMTTMARRAVANEAIKISGSGQQTRAWCYIGDFVEGLGACLLSQAARNQVFNLGNDETEITVLQLAELIRAIGKSSSPIVLDGMARSDVMERRPNIQKARKLLGYTPRIGMREGIGNVLNWLMNSRQPSVKLGRASSDKKSTLDKALAAGAVPQL